jgi:hypothetical protein
LAVGPFSALIPYESLFVFRKSRKSRQTGSSGST